MTNLLPLGFVSYQVNRGVPIPRSLRISSPPLRVSASDRYGCRFPSYPKHSLLFLLLFSYVPLTRLDIRAYFFLSKCPLFLLHSFEFSLVILTSRFEATRGLFYDGPRNFEPRSDEKDGK
ncbi:hypothetical protein AVEN_70736-1 [Araneus ventricosus]|uniref:Uncharacterized protein n=1 Tax=Araneus ventricosus TaxID=182803 RepID=A0A4Y2KL60_ARAVE|nr:hypothetical protein AVEN_70736-1 [Araneus ventricosus]